MQKGWEYFQTFDSIVKSIYLLTYSSNSFDNKHGAKKKKKI